MSDTRVRLQQILDECARQMERDHDWAERTSVDREARRWVEKQGRFDAHYQMAYYVIGVAHSAGIDLDGTRLERALERGDFL